MKTITDKNEKILLDSMEKISSLVEDQDQNPTQALYAVSKEANLSEPMIDLLAWSYNNGRSAVQRDEDSLLGKLATFPLADANEVKNLLKGTTVKEEKKAACYDFVSDEWTKPYEKNASVDNSRFYSSLKGPTITFKDNKADLPVASFWKNKTAEYELKQAEDDLELNGLAFQDCINKIASYLRKENRKSNEEITFGTKELFGNDSVAFLLKAAENAPSYKLTHNYPTYVSNISIKEKPYCFIKDAIASELNFKMACDKYKKSSYSGGHYPKEMADEDRKNTAIKEKRDRNNTKSNNEKSNKDDIESKGKTKDKLTSSQTSSKSYEKQPSSKSYGKQQNYASNFVFAAPMNYANYLASNGIVGGAKLLKEKVFPPHDFEGESYIPDPGHDIRKKRFQIMASLSDVMANDPVVKGYDSSVVLQTANDLLKAAPSLMDSPIALRAALREALAKGGGMSLFDVQNVNTTEDASRKFQLGTRDYVQKK